MRVVALDTTTPAGSVALWCDGHVLEIRHTDPAVSYGQQLPAALLSLVEAHGLTLREVDVFGVASGPGSMTGLRVGIATVQGLALALDTPVVPVSALEALATSALARCRVEPGARIGSLTNARRGEVFSALYEEVDGRVAEIDPPAVGLAEVVCERWAPLVSTHPLVVIGDGVLMSHASLDHWFAGLASLGDGGPLAGVVAELAARRCAGGHAVGPHAIHPLYVRRTDAEVARERRQTMADGVHPNRGAT